MDNSYLLSKINGALHYAYLTPRSSSRAFLSIFTIFSVLLVFINIVTGAGITSTSCLILCTQAKASRKATEFIWSTLHRKHTRGVEWHFKAQNTEVTLYRLYILPRNCITILFQQQTGFTNSTDIENYSFTWIMDLSIRIDEEYNVAFLQQISDL